MTTRGTKRQPAQSITTGPALHMPTAAKDANYAARPLRARSRRLRLVPAASAAAARVPQAAHTGSDKPGTA